MAKESSRQSPLTHLHPGQIAAAGDVGDPVRLTERPYRVQVNLRGDDGEEAFRNAVQEALGLTPPHQPNTALVAGDRTVLWLGPDEWLVAAPGESADEIEAALRQALSGVTAAVTDVGAAQTVIAVSGPRARDVLAKGCSLDLHPSVFAPGRTARSTVGTIDVILHQIDTVPTYELYVMRSFAEFLWLWLEDAALEYSAAFALLGTRE